MPTAVQQGDVDELIRSGRSLRVRVDQSARGAAKLHEAGFEVDVPATDRLSVALPPEYDPRQSAARVTRLLVECGVAVMELTAEGDSLESVHRRAIDSTTQAVAA